MTTDRREFLQLAALGGSLGLGLMSGAFAAEPTGQKAATALRILILGGTGFIGPHMVRHALARGHKITLFNRGKTDPGLFPEVENLKGDRDGGLDSLKGRTWDVVIDNSGYLPRLVRDSAELLKDAVGRYIFTSTVSVYPIDGTRGSFDEYGPVQIPEEPESEEIRKYYGQLKVLCEQAVEEAYPGRNSILRPTVIVGPGDPTDRFTYWPARIDKGGEVLAPGDPRSPIQYIDVIDLAEFFIHMAETGENGIYNVVGPEGRLSTAEFLYGIRAVSNTPVRFTWVDKEFLDAEDIQPWRDVPIWSPLPTPMAPPMFLNARAIAKGLKFRPLAQTTHATIRWFKTLPAERQANLKAGMSMEREAEVLAAWHAREK